MKSKSKAHHSLSTLFAQDGVPDVVATNNEMDQMAWDFKNKSRDADCHIRATEPFPPWINQAELGV